MEYVSESGKLYKTNKGSILKFKESTMEPEDKFGEKYENFIVALEKYGSHGQAHMFGPENMYVSIPRLGIKDVYDEVDKIRMAAEEVGWRIPPEGDIEKSIMNDRRIAAEIAILPAEEDLTGEYDESTKKFGKKFNESDAVQDAYDKYRACRTEPKVCQAIKVNDDGTEQKIGIWMDRGNSIGGIVKAIRDGKLRKVLKFSESTKKFGKKFRESTDLDEDLLQVIMNIKKDLLKSKWLRRVTSPGPGVNEEIDLETNEGKHYYLIVKPSVLNGY